MARQTKDVIENGRLVAENNHPNRGHFYRLDGLIYRAMPLEFGDHGIYPICTTTELIGLAKNGWVRLTQLC